MGPLTSHYRGRSPDSQIVVRCRVAGTRSRVEDDFYFLTGVGRQVQHQRIPLPIGRIPERIHDEADQLVVFHLAVDGVTDRDEEQHAVAGLGPGLLAYAEIHLQPRVRRDGLLPDDAGRLRDADRLERTAGDRDIPNHERLRIRPRLYRVREMID